MKDFIDRIPVGPESIRNQVEGHPVKDVGDQDVALPRGELFLDDSRDDLPDLILLQSLLRILGFGIFDGPVRRMITDMGISER
jgi:hypothetical protein